MCVLYISLGCGADDDDADDEDDEHDNYCSCI